MLSNTYSKTLCMNQLKIRLSNIPQSKFFDVQKNEKLTSAFIYIERGEAVLHTDTLSLPLQEGSLLYVPEKVFYTLKWLSEEDIQYYTIFATASDYNTTMMNDKFPLQIVKKLSSPQTGNTFAQIYELMQSGERIQKIKAVALYYDFYAQALQHLQSAPETQYHPALQKAMDYLSEHYNEELSVAKLAQICYISETRLYHLFQQQINTSPILFRNMKRVQKAAELLQTELSVEEICERTGFNSLPYFYRIFKEHTQLTPNEYRKLAHTK